MYFLSGFRWTRSFFYLLIFLTIVGAKSTDTDTIPTNLSDDQVPTIQDLKTVGNQKYVGKEKDKAATNVLKDQDGLTPDSKKGSSSDSLIAGTDPKKPQGAPTPDSKTSSPSNSATKPTKDQVMMMLKPYQKPMKRTIRRMAKMLDRERSDKQKRDSDNRVTVDDMKSGIEETFGVKWIYDTVLSIEKRLANKMAEYQNQLQKRGEDGTPTEEEQRNIVRRASRDVQKQLRVDFKDSGKAQLKALVDMARKKRAPKKAVMDKREYTVHDEYTSFIFNDKSVDDEEDDTEFETRLAARDLAKDVITDEFLESFFAPPKKRVGPHPKEEETLPLILPPPTKDSDVSLHRRALVEETPKNLAMWNVIFSLLTAVLFGPLFMASIGGFIAMFALTLLVLAPVANKILFGVWFGGTTETKHGTPEKEKQD